MIPTLLAAALVWLPAENFNSWGKVDELLRSHPGIKLTIGLTPRMASETAKSSLSSWVSTGRVEIAARIPGDPILPLVAAHPTAPRPDEALERTAEARQELESRLGLSAPGLIPGAGALDPSLIGPLSASGAAWVLTGPYPKDLDAWAAQGSVTFVPGRANTAFSPTLSDLSASGPIIFDETTQSESAFLDSLALLPSGARPPTGWTTISELVRNGGPNHAPAENVSSWPGWDGVVASAPTDPTARNAWQVYGEAAKALERYQNSGAADLKVLESATNLLRRAQDARFFRAPEPDAPAGLRADFRGRILSVFKRMKVPAPESLYSSANTKQSVSEQPTGVHISAGTNWVAFENPLGTISRAPLGAPNADPWRLRGLRVDWTDESVVFHIQTSRVDATPPAPRPIYDVYIDLNHVVGAGAIRLLEGRGAFAQARDAWEFALSVVGTDARLMRASAGDAEEIAAVKVDPDPTQAEIRVIVPRELLRGNPTRWGYIVLAAAEDSSRQSRFPASVLVGPDGAQTLGLVGPLEIQKSVIEHPGTPQRVSASRREISPSQ